jgi:hypothetical protein
MDVRGIGVEALRMLERSGLPITWHYVEDEQGVLRGITGDELADTPTTPGS